MRVGIIGGSGLLHSAFFSGLTTETVDTEHGAVVLRSGVFGDHGVQVLFCQRHAADPSGEYAVPHAINYRAIVTALRAKECDFVVGVCSVGSLRPTIGVGTLVAPDDFYCPYNIQSLHVDKRAHVVPELSASVRSLILTALHESRIRCQDGGVYTNTLGPRFETKSEIRMLALVGDVVGMTGAHEATLAVEAGLPYAMLCMVDNMANGVGAGDKLTLTDFFASQKRAVGSVERAVNSLLTYVDRNPAKVAHSIRPPPPEVADPLAASAAAAAGTALSTAAPSPDATASDAEAAASPTDSSGRVVVDLMVHARYVVPVEPESDQVLDHHAVAVTDGRVVAVLPSKEAAARYAARETVRLPKHVLMPGLVNAHTHVSMNLFRGVADDFPLLQWLTQEVWPLEGKFVDKEFVRDGSLHAIAEMIRGGTTCFNDMYFFPEVTAEVVEETGVRALLGTVVMDFPNPWGSGADEHLEKADALVRAWQHRCGRVRFSCAPHAPYTVSDANLRRVDAFSARHGGLPVHVHLHETRSECEDSVSGAESLSCHRSEERCRPMQNFKRLGLLSSRLIAVHMTQLTEEEVEWVAQSGTHVVHCPASNMKLASGTCPVARLLAAGANVAIGTDGSVSNNTLDMLTEMRLAAFLAKTVAEDPSAVPAHQALRMATLNGARALGLTASVGSLVPGKFADMVALELESVELMPVYNVISHLVYAASRSCVTDVWVQGKRLLHTRKLTTIDEAALLDRVRWWHGQVTAYKRQQDAALSGEGKGAAAAEQGEGDNAA